MQPLEDIFSSPEKTTTVNINGARTPSVNGAQYSENEDDDSDDFPMDIENSTSAWRALLCLSSSNRCSKQQPPQILPA
jgi:hypothetical protein